MLFSLIENYITDRSKAILLWWFLLFYVLVFIVNLVFSPPRFLVWESFLTAPFPKLPSCTFLNILQLRISMYSTANAVQIIQIKSEI